MFGKRSYAMLLNFHISIFLRLCVIVYYISVLWYSLLSLGSFPDFMYT